MWLARKAVGALLSAVGVSILGAVASNAAQMGLAGLLVFGDAVRLIAPPFLAAGLVTGALLGVFAELFAARVGLVRAGDGRDSWIGSAGAIVGARSFSPWGPRCRRSVDRRRLPLPALSRDQGDYVPVLLGRGMALGEKVSLPRDHPGLLRDRRREPARSRGQGPRRARALQG